MFGKLFTRAVVPSLTAGAVYYGYRHGTKYDEVIEVEQVVNDVHYGLERKRLFTKDGKTYNFKRPVWNKIPYFHEDDLHVEPNDIVRLEGHGFDKNDYHLYKTVDKITVLTNVDDNTQTDKPSEKKDIDITFF